MPDLEPVGRYYNKNPEPFPHKQFRFPGLLQNHYDNVVANAKKDPSLDKTEYEEMKAYIDKNCYISKQ
jgi:hypothetical protein